MLPLYFPRDKLEEEIAVSKLPADVGDENGETIIDERKIRIKPLPAVSASTPKPSTASLDLPVSDVGLTLRRLVKAKNHLFICLVTLLVYLTSVITDAKITEVPYRPRNQIRTL